MKMDARDFVSNMELFAQSVAVNKVPVSESILKYQNLFFKSRQRKIRMTMNHRKSVDPFINWQATSKNAYNYEAQLGNLPPFVQARNSPSAGGLCSELFYGLKSLRFY